MTTLTFKPDFAAGKSEIVEPLVGSSKPVALVRFVVPDGAKVSCQKAEFCSSYSKRLKGFVCGSGYSHIDRCGSCVEYLRLCQRLPSGMRGGHPV